MVLVLNAFLVQGASLSNTAIEKYLKAVYIVRGTTFPRTHNILQFSCMVRFAPLHEGYLRALAKAYRLRYPDDLPVGFNIGLSQSQMLAELDTSVYRIRGGFQITFGNGRSPETALELLLAQDNPQLLARNNTRHGYLLPVRFARRIRRRRAAALQGAFGALRKPAQPHDD